MSLTDKIFGGDKPAEKADTNANIFEKKEDGKKAIDKSALFQRAAPAQKESRRQRQKRQLEERLKSGKKGAAPDVKLPVKKHLSHAKDDHKEEDLRTVFVGNLPNSADKKNLKKFFSKCGEVESVRLRCQMLAEQPEEAKQRGRGVRILRGELRKDEEASAIGYVLFKRRESVAKAVALSGQVFENRHLSIGSEDDAGKAFSPKDSLFLGNLAPNTTDEDIWNFFLTEGFQPRQVRIIRDRDTGAAKGIGYVSLVDANKVNEALGLRNNGKTIRDREVRITHVQKSKKANNVQLRRDVRKAQQSMATPAGPHARGSQRDPKRVELKRQKGATNREEKKKSGDDERPAWMGNQTNPRKKLARDLRGLVDPVAKIKAKKMMSRRGGPPAAKRPPARPPKN